MNGEMWVVARADAEGGIGALDWVCLHFRYWLKPLIFN